MADEQVTPEVTDDGGSIDLDGLRQALDLNGPPGEQAPEGAEGTVTTEPSTAPVTYTLSDGTTVTLEELEGGYLRQSDYTRKTQELAQQRAGAEQALRLMQALSEDPVGTLQVLQQNLLGEDEGDLDPYEQQLQAHEERFAQLENERWEAELDRVLQGLEQQYEGFDRDAVMAWAVEHKIQNLEAAYTHMQAVQQRDAERQAKNAAALQRKSTVPPLGGRSRSLGGDAPAFIEVKNARDAMHNALIELDAQS